MQHIPGQEVPGEMFVGSGDIITTKQSENAGRISVFGR
jgi:hypothetical protein